MTSFKRNRTPSNETTEISGADIILHIRVTAWDYLKPKLDLKPKLKCLNYLNLLIVTIF